VRVLAIVHHRNAAVGVFADPVLAGGHEFVEWLPEEGPAPDLESFDAGMIFGAEAQVDQEERYPWLRPEKQLIRDLLERGTPTLGVCFGSQLLAEAAGADVRRAAHPEIGWYEVDLTPEGRADPLTGSLPERFESFQYHHYEWLLPQGAVALARNPSCLQAFRLDGRPIWGVQFHPEVTLSDLGEWLDELPNDAAAVAAGFDPEAIKAESAEKVGTWNDIGRELAERFLELSRVGSDTPR
jgi:GMP synthase-like glutamine amidotransferase